MPLQKISLRFDHYCIASNDPTIPTVWRSRRYPLDADRDILSRSKA